MASAFTPDGQSAPIVSMEPISLPIEQAAEAVGLSRRYLDGAISTGDLVAVGAGSKTLILVEDLRAWIRSLPVKERKSKKDAA